MTNLVEVTYAQTGNSKSTNKLGMRAMQSRAYDARDAQYLLLKAPPASGKSRALMFIALDKLMNQGIKKVIVAVPEKSIGSSFSSTDLKSYGFYSNWEVEDIFTLKNVPKTDKDRADADFVATRISCKNFDEYENRFKLCQKELKEGKRRLVDSVESQLQVGTFCVLDGVLLYIAKIELGKRGNSNKINRRTLLIFENGTQSNMLLRSLGKRLKDSGKMLTHIEGRELDGLSGITKEDNASGFIYVLKSKSSDDRISTKKNLYKIGFAKEDVNRRVANAINEPTYLMASVSIVSVYQCFNMNPQKLEQLLHKFFGKSCLDIEIFDKNGNKHHPREWFIAPLAVIDEAIELIISGKIIHYLYDAENESIVERRE